MFHGVPVDPFLPEKQKIHIVKRLYHGETPNEDTKNNKLPDAKEIKEADQLVSQITTSIKMEKVTLLLPKYSEHKEEAVTLSQIVKFFHLKKAKFEYYMIPKEKKEEHVFEFLCILKQCMEFGFILLVNIDSGGVDREFLGW